MGNLTNDMTRLRGDVDALRSDRMALMHELARGASNLTTDVANMRDDFTAAHKAMAKKTGKERKAFVAEVISDTNSLLGTCFRDRINMAKKGRRDRGIFLTKMRNEVTGMCQETADDLMGARLVWRGESPRRSRPLRLKKEPTVIFPKKKTKKGKK